ncbi:lactonase family protein [Metabacillus iocasae]|uniref:6-phosphogluconolactonase n=1 Tax=Priestia iocasae TaxID=2291674 RepID=A0ABS2QVG4_9BACI|nr:lactonase family protein [Metabacillus iocasae]MBM7703412.1 6-phosphogluconolactonase [Metabacillus iocasae]
MTTNQSFIGYVGTYTKGESKGIYTFTLDTTLKKISDVKLAATVENPTYVTVNEANNTLYAVAKDGELGGVSAYSINSKTGELTERNKQLTEGANPCHVSVNRSQSLVVTSNYHKGTVESYVVNEDGTLNAAASVIEHTGSGPNKDRQEKPHVHYADFTPDERYVAVVDLGIDKVITYKVNEDGTLTEANTLLTTPGSGPRHLVFHPNGKFAYIMTELSSEVIALSYNEDDGSFTELQSILTIPSDFTENNQGSAIHISSDGQFVYAGNRGHDSIAIFSVNQDTGELTFVDRTSTEGDWPRDFVLDPTEEFLIASNQESHNLVLFKRDKETGKLELVEQDITVPYPVCIKFLTK